MSELKTILVRGGRKPKRKQVPLQQMLTEINTLLNESSAAAAATGDGRLLENLRTLGFVQK